MVKIYILLLSFVFSKNNSSFNYLPKHEESKIISHFSYTLNYNEMHEQASWVAYRLTGLKLQNPITNRIDNFRTDPKIITGSATLSDYKGSGYDRGHLAPAADMAWSEKAMSESFYLSNMSPQVPGLNRGMWKDLEARVRDWSMVNEELYVYTGALIRPGYKSIGTNKVTVPQWYYKVIVDVHPPELKAIAFIMPNRKPQKSMQEFVVTIDKLEEVTGLDFLSALNDAQQSKLESSYDLSKWSFKKMDYSAWETNKKNPNPKESKSGVLYWISASSKKRHNPNCRFYKQSKGHSSLFKDGVACKSCGG